MKFVVTRPYGTEVDVKLHWETKDKLKRAFTLITGVVVTVGGIVYIRNDNKKNKTDIEK